MTSLARHEGKEQALVAPVERIPFSSIGEGDQSVLAIHESHPEWLREEDSPGQMRDLLPIVGEEEKSGEWKYGVLSGSTGA
jgi:hypothetical protein